MSIKDEAEAASDLKYSSYPEPQRSLLSSGYERGYVDGASRKVERGDEALIAESLVDPSEVAVQVTDDMVARAHEAWQTSEVYGLEVVREMLIAALGGGAEKPSLTQIARDAGIPERSQAGWSHRRRPAGRSGQGRRGSVRSGPLQGSAHLVRGVRHPGRRQRPARVARVGVFGCGRERRLAVLAPDVAGS